MEISTSCAHCGRFLHIVIDDRFRWRVLEPGADPRIFIPHIDWQGFRHPNILNDY